MIQASFWQNKKVLITGHTGFKGSWLCLWLQKMGAQICGIGLPPVAPVNLFNDAHVAQNMQSIMSDIRDLDQLITLFQTFSPDIVIHLAAQSLVRHAYVDPVFTYTTNVIGTVNVLEAVRRTQSVRAVINVTSDKCYENHEWVWGYRENDSLGGRDPYSNSKACAELVTAAYRTSFFTVANKLTVGLATARAGNVIGGGDFALDRLVPDFVRASLSKQNLNIRHPHAIRPWQHVLESLSGYLLLAEKLFASPNDFSQAWNFGPDLNATQTVLWMVEKLKKLWGKEAATWSKDNEFSPHEAHHLKLDCEKSKTLLHWKPTWNIQQSLEACVAWYQAHHASKEMHDFSMKQIDAFEKSFHQASTKNVIPETV